MRHLISMLLQNEAGALARVAGLFASRGYNIETLTVAGTQDEDVSRLSLTVSGDDTTVEQIVKQSAKLVDVIEIADLTAREHVERELVVVHMTAPHGAVDTCLARLGGRLLQRTDAGSIVEYTGPSKAIDAFLDAIGPVDPLFTHARSGVAAIGRAWAHAVDSEVLDVE
jgi:acetolactate synthase-1/3 small subunit